MSLFGVNGWELAVLAILAVLLLGDRMPEYAAKLARLVQTVRTMAEGAKGQLKDQLGPEYEDIDWRQYDPRQYDPRRIVRQALLDPIEDAMSPLRDDPDDDGEPAPTDVVASTAYDPNRPTPYDTDAT